MNKSEFSITGWRGFHITFLNGNTVSVQFGGGNYCDRRDDPIVGIKSILHGENYSCVNAEIAIWDIEGEWFNFETLQFKEGEPIGYVTPDEVGKYIQAAMTNDFSKLKEERKCEKGSKK